MDPIDFSLLELPAEEGVYDLEACALALKPSECCHGSDGTGVLLGPHLRFACGCRATRVKG